jgi:FkbM family methyltransferase
MERPSITRRLSEWTQSGGHRGIKIVQRHLLRRRYIEKKVNGYRLLLDADDPGLSRELLDRGTREPEQRFIVERLLRPGLVAFDLGANLGYYTVMMAKLVGQRGAVYAVEPFPDSFRLLDENIRRNRLFNVHIDDVAIAAADGERQFLLTRRANWHSLHAPHVNSAVPWQAKYAREIIGSMRVRTQTLQRYLSDKEPIDLLRMDLEGYEVEVLRSVCGLPESQTRRLRILFETHPEFYDPVHNDMRSVLTKLFDHGFRCEYLISDFHRGARRQKVFESGRSVFLRYGYSDQHAIRHFPNRVVYPNVHAADAIELICNSECVHAAVLAPTPRSARAGSPAASAPTD